MRKLKIIKLLKIAVEIFGPKGMRWVDVRRRGNLHVWHLSWR